MVKINRKMQKIIDDIPALKLKIPNELYCLIKDGFIEIEKCYLISSQYKNNTNVSLKNFQDRTGYECFINSIHIDDFVMSNHLCNSLVFVNLLFEKWNLREEKNKIKAIIIADEMGVLVKIHTIRDGEFWIEENIEEYEEAILTADSSDVLGIF